MGAIMSELAVPQGFVDVPMVAITADAPTPVLACVRPDVAALADEAMRHDAAYVARLTRAMEDRRLSARPPLRLARP